MAVLVLVLRQTCKPKYFLPLPLHEESLGSGLVKRRLFLCCKHILRRGRERRRTAKTREVKRIKWHVSLFGLHHVAPPPGSDLDSHAFSSEHVASRGFP